MAILASEVLTHVNGLLFPNQTGVASIDTKLRGILKEMSSRGLLETSATLTMSSSADFVAYPTGLIVAKSIQAEDYDPLLLLQWEVYISLMADDDSTDIPEYFVPHAKRLYFYHPCSVAGAALTWTIAYSYLHPDDVDSILFGEEYRQAIYDGVTWLVARNKQRYAVAKEHEALYSNALYRLGAIAPSTSGCVAYYDLGG